MTKRGALLIAALISSSCAARTAPPPSTAGAASTTAPHENLNAVAWMQTAIEFEASAVQAYQLARLRLDEAMKDPAWSAAIEQTGGTTSLPHAVILDVDETVLDNSYYQARLIRDRATFSDSTWGAWVKEAKATAIPGALDFTRYAAGRGVTVFYVTNRTADGETATRANLAALGFPLDAKIDTVLTKGEMPEWSASAKGPRRAHIARTHRILLLIGDDLGDFIANASGTLEERRMRTEPNAQWWGQRWIMVPNPSYGSWERALIGSSADPMAAKRAALRYQPR